MFLHATEFQPAINGFHPAVQWSETQLSSQFNHFAAAINMQHRHHKVLLLCGVSFIVATDESAVSLRSKSANDSERPDAGELRILKSYVECSGIPGF